MCPCVLLSAIARPSPAVLGAKLVCGPNPPVNIWKNSYSGPPWIIPSSIVLFVIKAHHHRGHLHLLGALIDAGVDKCEPSSSNVLCSTTGFTCNVRFITIIVAMLHPITTIPSPSPYWPGKTLVDWWGRPNPTGESCPEGGKVRFSNSAPSSAFEDKRSARIRYSLGHMIPARLSSALLTNYFAGRPVLFSFHLTFTNNLLYHMW